MTDNLKPKYYFLLLCYLYLFFFPQIGKADPIQTDHFKCQQFFLDLHGLRSDIFLDPKLNQTWEQVVARIWQANRMFLSFSIEKRSAEPVKNYPDDNLDLDFNFPFLCYKFPLNEHTKEG
jgi:hypothetical protein